MINRFFTKITDDIRSSCLRTCFHPFSVNHHMRQSFAQFNFLNNRKCFFFWSAKKCNGRTHQIEIWVCYYLCTVYFIPSRNFLWLGSVNTKCLNTRSVILRNGSSTSSHNSSFIIYQFTTSRFNIQRLKTNSIVIITNNTYKISYDTRNCSLIRAP